MSIDPTELQHLHADAATRRPGGRTARVGEAVIEATLAELSESGYAALRIEAVAERAGVNKTTIYRRWGKKSGLVATALIERQGELVPVPDTGDVRSDALALLQEIRRALSTPWIAAMVREIVPPGKERDGVHEVLDKLWPERFRVSREIFVRAIERDQLPSDADPDFLVEAACGPLYFRWLMLGQPLDDDFLRRTVDLLLDGARAASSA